MNTIAKLPRPRGLPLLGNALQLDPPRLHLQMERWAEELGPLYRFSAGPRQFVAVADAAAIQQVLRERPEGYTRLNGYETTAIEMGLNGVFSAEHERWRRHRRVWMASLNAHQLRGFHQQVALLTGRLLRRWQAAADRSEVIEPVPELMRYTVDVTMRVALGHEANTLEQADEDLIQHHLNRVFPALARRIAAPFPYWRWVTLPADRALAQSLKALHHEVGVLIAAARERLAQDPARHDAPGCFLEALLVARERDPEALSEADVFANAITVLLGGEDTTANTLAWFMHLCCTAPEATAALRAEVDALFDQLGLSGNALPSPEQLPSYLPHLDSALNETLRLYPVAPVYGISVARDTTLLGTHLPAGTDLFLLARSAAQAAPASQPPPQFDPNPERSAARNGAGSGRAPSLPFGYGPRLCPGRNLALAEMRSVALMLLRHFELTAVPGRQPVSELFSFTLVPQHLHVRLTRRLHAGKPSA